MAQNGYFSSYSPQITATNYMVTSATNQTINTTGVILATVTPVAGTYLVIASCSLTGTNTAGNLATIGILYNSSYQTGSLQTSTPQNTVLLSNFQNMSITTHSIVTVNGSLALQVAGYTNTGTITVNPVILDVVRIA